MSQGHLSDLTAEQLAELREFLCPHRQDANRFLAAAAARRTKDTAAQPKAS